ncbi:MAG: hypothetical protein A4E19_15435 [Nitrospira sp. SG-bin1]|nr:MAG: hypothetical protein A4E19_15435 [Nitrospira sp. SG-bin1]
MGLLGEVFDKKTDPEKRREAEAKEIKKEAREDRKEARQDAREEKKEARQDARDDKKEARQDKRDDMKEIRQSNLNGEEKREAKADVRDDKQEAIRDAKDDKRDSLDRIQDTKKDMIEDIRLQEKHALATASAPGPRRLDIKLAQELLNLTWNVEVGGTIDGFSLRGETIGEARAISGKNWKSDTECFVARSNGNDVIVAFRGSESPFTPSGGFRDWALTNFRSERIAYPPAPKSWPDQRWVHAGFWQAYQIIRNVLMAEVTRQATQMTPARRIFVTGYSLGGALAVLAALDIAEGMAAIDRANGNGTIPVELFTFAAPRVGDANLNNLLAERVNKSTLIAFGGDPVVHLPPLGPNFPITFEHPIGLDLAGIHIGLGTPIIPQAGQQYRTADTLFYIDKDGIVSNSYPMAQVALNFRDHFPPDRYQEALLKVENAQSLNFGPTSTQTTTAKTT